MIKCNVVSFFLSHLLVKKMLWAIACIYISIIIMLCVNVGVLYSAQYKDGDTKTAFYTMGIFNIISIIAMFVFGLMYLANKRSRLAMCLLSLCATLVFSVNAYIFYWGYGPAKQNAGGARWTLMLLNFLAAVCALILMFYTLFWIKYLGTSAKPNYQYEKEILKTMLVPAAKRGKYFESKNIIEQY